MQMDLWLATAGNQNRDSFALGAGKVAAADRDEWDDADEGASG